jgi:dihydrodipicolinate synthase/N-acetylneuraminate lyase
MMLLSYCPLVTPFTQDEEVDFNALVKQVLRLAKAGMGIVLLGTNGEGECFPQ